MISLLLCTSELIILSAKTELTSSTFYLCKKINIKISCAKGPFYFHILSKCFDTKPFTRTLSVPRGPQVVSEWLVQKTRCWYLKCFVTSGIRAISSKDQQSVSPEPGPTPEYVFSLFQAKYYEET